MRKILLSVALTGLLAAGLVAFASPRGPSDAELLAVAQHYDARILRDTWGVPHIFGKTDADVGFGLAYAHAQDDFATIQMSLLAARGMLASAEGFDTADVYDSPLEDLLEAGEQAGQTWVRLASDNASYDFLYELLAFDRVTPHVGPEDTVPSDPPLWLIIVPR